MNKRTRKHQKNSILKNIMFEYIKNNMKEYLIVSILFVIGVIIGVIFINNVSEMQELEINNYITSFINGVKEEQEIDDLLLLKDSVLKNIIIVVLLWFMGSTVIGISIVYLIVIIRGFILGYTISASIFILGTNKGLVFITTSLFLQTIIVIPCILALAVSGMKLYNSIMKDRRKENIKLEILRHSLFSLFILVILIIYSLIEVYISKNLLLLCISYI